MKMLLTVLFFFIVTSLYSQDYDDLYFNKNDRVDLKRTNPEYLTRYKPKKNKNKTKKVKTPVTRHHVNHYWGWSYHNYMWAWHNPYHTWYWYNPYYSFYSWNWYDPYYSFYSWHEPYWRFGPHPYYSWHRSYHYVYYRHSQFQPYHTTTIHKQQRRTTRSTTYIPKTRSSSEKRINFNGRGIDYKKRTNGRSTLGEVKVRARKNSSKQLNRSYQRNTQQRNYQNRSRSYSQQRSTPPSRSYSQQRSTPSRSRSYTTPSRAPSRSPSTSPSRSRSRR